MKTKSTKIPEYYRSDFWTHLEKSSIILKFDERLWAKFLNPFKKYLVLFSKLMED